MENKTSPEWNRYFNKNKNRDVRPLFSTSLQFVERKMNQRTALDLGCGIGIETTALLENNFSVDAVDNQPESKRHVESIIKEDFKSKLSFYLSDFSDFNFNKKYDFVYAYHSLPFSKNEDFLRVTYDAIDSVKPNGIFSGSFFGDRDEWSLTTKVNGISKDYLQKAFSSFQVLYFNEIFEAEQIHTFDVIARKQIIHDKA